MATDAHGALSWRDVYRAVNESEGRIIASFRETIGPLKDAAEDHEKRLRRIEEYGSNEAKEALRRVGVLEGQVQPLATAQVDRDRRLAIAETKADAATEGVKAFQNRESGIFSTLGATRTFILALVAVVGGIIGILATAIDLVSHASGS